MMRGISSFHLMRKAKTTRKDERETKRGKHEKADKNTGKVKAAIHRGEGAAWRAEGVFFFLLFFLRNTKVERWEWRRATSTSRVTI